MHIKKALLVGCILCTTVLYIANGWASDRDRSATYQITITNLTLGQPIAPLMAATHRPGISFFKAGDAATPELATLAEAGDGNPMAALLITMQGYSDAQVGAGATGPGMTTTMTITARNRIDHLSLGAMLVNTNDAFIALRDVKLPKTQQAVTYFADVYDAGSETNDEFCSNIPGPACGGAALSPEDDGEGFVYIHNGIHGIGGLDAATYDWRNPAAQIVIKRIN